MLDIIIKNGTIIDGTGKKRYKGSIGIKDNKIETIGEVTGKANKEINGDGYIVCPGFIDFHSHSDIALLDDNASFNNFLEQGITTEIVGMCGGTVSPMTLEQTKEQYAILKGERNDTEAEKFHRVLKDYASYLGYLEYRKMGTNMSFYIGHSTIREAVMGFKSSKPNNKELEEMKNHVRIAMEAGAVGLSSGLIYPPGSYASEDELVELCKVVAEYGGSYSSHIRSEGDKLFEAVKEIINIGRRSGVSVNISHIKIAGKDNWGTHLELLKLIDDANCEGIEVTADMYPYKAGATTIRSAIPHKFAEVGQSKLIEKMKDPKFRQKVKDEIYNPTENFENLIAYCGFDGVLVLTAPNKELIGKTIAEIAKERNKDEFETFCDINVETNGLGFCAFFMRNDEDIDNVFRHPMIMGGTDGAIESTTYPVFHPRHTGTFPKLMKDLVIDKKLVSIEEAIRKFCSLPAKTAKIDKFKGYIKKGYDADVLVIDIDKMDHSADYFNPKGKNKGFKYVIVNGKIVVENDEFNGVNNGRLLRSNK